MDLVGPPKLLLSVVTCSYHNKYGNWGKLENRNSKSMLAISCSLNGDMVIEMEVIVSPTI